MCWQYLLRAEVCSDRACSRTGELSSWGMSTFTTPGATAARWWQTPPSSLSSSPLTCKLLVSLQTLLSSPHWPCPDLPDEKPRIIGIKEKYQIGETLSALCTSWQSHPPANLSWFINEEKVELSPHTDQVIILILSGQRWLSQTSEDPRGVRRHLHLGAWPQLRDLPAPLQGGGDQAEVQLQPADYLLAEQHGESVWWSRISSRYSCEGRAARGQSQTGESDGDRTGDGGGPSGGHYWGPTGRGASAGPWQTLACRQWGKVQRETTLHINSFYTHWSLLSEETFLIFLSNCSCCNWWLLCRVVTRRFTLWFSLYSNYKIYF